MDTRLGWTFALGGLLFVSGFIVRSFVRRGDASTERAPTLLATMQEAAEERGQEA